MHTVTVDALLFLRNCNLPLYRFSNNFAKRAVTVTDPNR